MVAGVRPALRQRSMLRAGAMAKRESGGTAWFPQLPDIQNWLAGGPARVDRIRIQLPGHLEPIVPCCFASGRKNTCASSLL